MSGIPDEVATERQWQTQRAAQRFEETEAGRARTREAQQRTGYAVHDTFDQVRARGERLIELREAPVEAVMDVALLGVADRQAVYERIIGASNDLQSVSFLARGLRAAAPVARIVLAENGRELPYGTGFLVSPELLLTNHHVLGDADLARRVLVEFGAEVDIDHRPRPTVRHRLDPAAFFVADRELDFALVRVLPGGDGRPPGTVFGWNPLLRTQGKVVTGESVNIVGHPMGRLKEITVRGNRVDQQTEDFLQYSADTERGSSGSPVFNDQWEVVALHHSAVPRRDARGRRLRVDGTPARHGDPDSALAWVGNEGTRVSSILGFLSTLEFTAAQRGLLAGMGPGAVAAPPDASGPLRLRERSPRTRGASLPGADTDGVRLVFVHGRGQQGLAPAQLRDAWTAGLNTGLNAAGLPGVRSAAVWFPYYGDLLAERTGVGEARGGAADAPAPRQDEPRAVYESMLAQAALRSGMPAELMAAGPAGSAEEAGLLGAASSAVVSRLQRQLSWVAARSGLDEALIALLIRDVAGYLGRASVRGAVLDAVAAGFPESGEVVVVAHSLGTVVAMDLLARARPDVTVPLLVTAGSPLGLDAVHDRVLHRPPGAPDSVGSWLNAWSPADAVAIGCPLAPVWGAGLTEVVTANSHRRPHDIEEYLRHPEVALRIAGALRPGG
ncbi:trypsin-like peptidase domain-containing protein [Actinorugispora endophytica]|uniref:Serine protease n=1 Tax=Actinorugispora endophytica TaxID=1605990 RepID=A0A4R6UVZ9_9ACTN|nr:trypsin-like peptidase domain-containing protein [Actinorugispora endophytica]TDQ51530.1 V8-like Glu-specific endopeptidase [Actinorugispora endophytica]